MNHTAPLCTIGFKTDSDRKKALNQLIHVMHVGYSGVGDKRIVIPKKACVALEKKHIKIIH